MFVVLDCRKTHGDSNTILMVHKTTITCPVLSVLLSYACNVCPDFLGWLKEQPRPPIFAFFLLADKFKDRRCLGRRSKPSLPYDVRNGATVSAADGCGTARAEIFDQACMAIDTMVLLADGEHQQNTSQNI